MPSLFTATRFATGLGLAAAYFAEGGSVAAGVGLGEVGRRGAQSSSGYEILWASIVCAALLGVALLVFGHRSRATRAALARLPAQRRDIGSPLLTPGGSMRARAIIASCVPVVLVLAACGGDDDDGGAGGADVDPVVAGEPFPTDRCDANKAAGTITYLSGFDFAAAASIMEVMMAADRGYYDDLCLDVEAHAELLDHQLSRWSHRTRRSSRRPARSPSWRASRPPTTPSS